MFPKITSFSPLEHALVFFTDGSFTGKAAYVCNGSATGFQTSTTSAQLTELQATVAVLSDFLNQPLNIYTDSAYIACSVPLLETAGLIKNVSETSKYF